MEATTDISVPVSFTGNAIAEIKRLMGEDGFDTTKLLGGCKRRRL
jgi:hypothetical protein